MTEVPFNRLKSSEDEVAGSLAAFDRLMRHGPLIHGPEHTAFERGFAGFCGTAECVGVANGTDALEIVLRAAGVTPGDEVILQANAGFYSSTALLAIGAIPVYADVLHADHQIDTASVRRCLSSRTRAVIVTHLYGQMGPVEILREFCDAENLRLIEDCAQAHGAETGGRRAGAWGCGAAFSFYPTKNLGALGDGGAITTSSAALAARARSLRQYGWSEKYVCAAAGRNSRLDEIQAAVLNIRLPGLDAQNSRRREIVSRFDEAAAGALRIVHGSHGADFVGHLAIACHPAREEVRGNLSRKGIATAIHYPLPDHLQPALQHHGHRKDALDVTESLGREIFSLPCFPDMTESEVDHVCQALSEVQ